MRKTTVWLIAALMLCASVPPVFAAGTLADVAGTHFEESVTYLLEKGVVSGDTDGRYRPEDSITRAEACVVIVRAINPSEAELNSAKSSGFTDLNSYSWAEKYINYAVSKGIVSGKGSGRFAPGDPVTYTEYAAMIMNTFNVSDTVLEGNWPDNYFDVAYNDDLFAYILIEEGADFRNLPATRGNVAVMTWLWGDTFDYAPDYILAFGRWAEGSLGDKLLTTWFAFSVDSANVVAEYAGYTPEEGEALLDVVVTLEHAYSDESVPMFDADFWLEWGDDGVYCLDPADETMMPAEFFLEPGQTVNYHLVFAVPQAALAEELAVAFVEILAEEEGGEVNEAELYQDWFVVYLPAK